MAGGWNVFSVERLIFFPDREVGDPPPGVEEKWMKTADGVALHGWYVPGNDARVFLLWSHGNAGNIAGRVDVALALARRGLNVMAYDYRGYGKSGGRPSEQGVNLDALAAYDHLLESGAAPDRIVCFGESLGGAVSLRLATERPCAGVAVVSTFTRMRDVASYHYGFLGGLVGDRFDSLSVMDKLDRPLFVAHGDRDEVVPYRLGVELYRAASGPKEFFEVPGAGHNDILGSRALLDAIAEFAKRVAADS